MDNQETHETLDTIYRMKKKQIKQQRKLKRRETQTPSNILGVNPSIHEDHWLILMFFVFFLIFYKFFINLYKLIIKLDMEFKHYFF